MIREQAINLLTLGLSDGDSNQIVTAFRKAGRVTRNERVTDIAQLEDTLSKSDWDLILLDEQAEAFGLEPSTKLIKQLGLDLPVIVITDDNADRAINGNIAGFFAHHELHQLCRSALREMSALQTRREMAELRSALDEAQQRNELLLSDHSDAVCYITDGMIIHANTQFCERVGLDELDGFPIVDLLAQKDQERFKNLLKKQSQGLEPQKLELNFRHTDGNEFKSILSCDNASYDGEKCIQLTLQEGGDSISEGQVDVTTGLSNRSYFLRQLQEFLEHERGSNSSLILIAIDDFNQHRNNLGLLEVEEIVKRLGAQLQQILPYQHLGRVGDDIFALVTNHVPSNQALEQTQELLQSIESQIIEINRKSIQCTLSAAILPINHLTPPEAATVMRQCFSSVQQLLLTGGNQAIIYTKERQQLSREDSLSDVIAEAFTDQRFRLLFQPMVNLSDAEGDHYEVFLDIKDWQEGEVTAGEVMRVIERDPLNNKLDRWIIVESTKLLAQKQLTGEGTRLLINLTGNVFHDHEFCAWLSVALKAAGLPTHAVTLQFNEESIAHSLKPALEFNRQIKDLGIAIAVRNFGRSKGGNKFLEHIGPSIVKPGARQTDSLSTDEIKQFVQQARHLGSRILIPNVSSAATLATLWQMGPDFIQGSYVHDPLPSMDYEFSAFG